MRWVVLALLVLLVGCRQPEPTLPLDTPLSVAARSGDVVAVRNLLESGTDADEPLIGWSRPLDDAVRTGQVDTARLLIKHGAKVEPQYNDSDLLVQAAASGDVQMIRLLLKSGESARVSGAQALLEAAKHDRLDAVRELVSDGAETNWADSSGLRALDYAAQGSSLALVKFLVEKGAASRVPTSTGPISADRKGALAAERRFYGLKPPTVAESKAIQDYLQKSQHPTPSRKAP